jgi:hypothetical protein
MDRWTSREREADTVSHAGGREGKGKGQSPGFPSRMNKGQGLTLDPRSRAQAHLRAYARLRSFPGRPGPGITVALISDKGKPRGKVKSRVPPGAGQLISHSPRYQKKVTSMPESYTSFSQRSLDALPYLIRVGV